MYVIFLNVIIKIINHLQSITDFTKIDVDFCVIFLVVIVVVVVVVIISFYVRNFVYFPFHLQRRRRSKKCDDDDNNCNSKFIHKSMLVAKLSKH
jgi:uncharacterized membrane-anchored protein